MKRLKIDAQGPGHFGRVLDLLELKIVRSEDRTRFCCLTDDKKEVEIETVGPVTFSVTEFDLTERLKIAEKKICLLQGHFSDLRWKKDSWLISRQKECDVLEKILRGEAP